MATGLVSSNSRITRAADAPAPDVLRSGEKQASTPEALKNPNSRVFFHHVAGAKFIMPDGLELQFLGGRLVTDDASIIAELEKVANKSASMIYTDAAAGQSVVAAAQKQAASDAADSAGSLPDKA
jgi:hypothetical protein